jgi:hypothetical protein
MDNARNSGREDGEPVGHFDAERALVALDEYLGRHRHPVPKVERIHALEIATGIAARAPGGRCTEVSGQLRTVLRRHGIFINDLRPR